MAVHHHLRHRRHDVRGVVEVRRGDHLDICNVGNFREITVQRFDFRIYM